MVSKNSGNGRGDIATAVTVSSTAAASLVYIYYYWYTNYSKKYSSSTFFQSMNIAIRKYLKGRSGSRSSDDHGDNDYDSDDSGISYGGDGGRSHTDFASFGLSFSATQDMNDADLSYRDGPDGKGGAGTGAYANTPSSSCIYLDYNGTTPVDQRVIAAMLPYLTTHFGNPSSSHYFGAVPKEAITKARQSILGLLHPNHVSKSRLSEEQDAIIFTGCGTEADNLAIHLAIQSNKHRFTKTSWKGDRNLPNIVTSNVEHPAIAQYLQSLQQQNVITITYVPVNAEGYVTYEDIVSAINQNTVLVTLMLANNESGALQPVKSVAEYCKMNSILFHTDAAQAVGKVSVALDETGIGDGVDMITIVGHKFGAPKGIGCLYVRPGCLKQGERREADAKEGGYLLVGGGQEGGQRAGTENVPYIVALGTAADILTAKTKYRQIAWKKNASRMESMRKRLLQNLTSVLGESIVRPNGPEDSSKRLPNTLSVGLRDVQSGELLKAIQMSVACSAGSACHSSGGKLSPVLEAMEVPLNFARGTLRLSVGPDTTQDDVDLASKIIVKEVKRQLDL